MVQAYIPTEGGPHSMDWPLGVFPNSEDDAGDAPGPTGISPPDDFLVKSVRVVAIDFESDHRNKMTDKGHSSGGEKGAGNFEPGGKPFSQDWTYIFNPDFLESKSYPVSHTGDRNVSLLVAVSNEYAKPVEATLTGWVLNSDVADGMRFVVPDRTFEPGITLVRIISDKPLHKKIQAAEFKVGWEFTGSQVSSRPSPRLFYAPPMTTTNELFITLGEPLLEGNEITYERMAHAVQKAGAANHTSAHRIVEALVHSLEKRFSMEYGTSDAWFFARMPNTTIQVDCISIARYVAAILQMVGIRGTVEPVIVYVQPTGPIQWESLVPRESDPKKRRIKGFPAPSQVQKLKLLGDVTDKDFEVVEKPNPPAGTSAGLNWPMIFHPRDPWHLMLLDGAENPNAFEGCVKFTPLGGVPKWYPAGTQLVGIDKVQDVIPKTFKSLSWVDDSNKPRVPAVKNYH
jgi:hypothetical protein